jgi:hypothetical protein
VFETYTSHAYPILHYAGHGPYFLGSQGHLRNRFNAAHGAKALSKAWAEITAEICAGGQTVLPGKHVYELFTSETRKIFAAIVKWLRQKNLTQLQRKITVNSLSWQDCLSSKGF